MNGLLLGQFTGMHMRREVVFTGRGPVACGRMLRVNVEMPGLLAPIHSAGYVAQQAIVLSLSPAARIFLTPRGATVTPYRPQIAEFVAPERVFHEQILEHHAALDRKYDMLTPLFPVPRRHWWSITRGGREGILSLYSPPFAF